MHSLCGSSKIVDPSVGVGAAWDYMRVIKADLIIHLSIDTLSVFVVSAPKHSPELKKY